eukprot:scaffold219593_cov38-Prasinocladus_malaysianus.AAC.1
MGELELTGRTACYEPIMPLLAEANQRVSAGILSALPLLTDTHHRSESSSTPADHRPSDSSWTQLINVCLQICPGCTKIGLDNNASKRHALEDLKMTSSCCCQAVLDLYAATATYLFRNKPLAVGAQTKHSDEVLARVVGAFLQVCITTESFPVASARARHMLAGAGHHRPLDDLLGSSAGLRFIALDVWCPHTLARLLELKCKAVIAGSMDSKATGSRRRSSGRQQPLAAFGAAEADQSDIRQLCGLMEELMVQWSPLEMQNSFVDTSEPCTDMLQGDLLTVLESSRDGSKPSDSLSVARAINQSQIISQWGGLCLLLFRLAMSPELSSMPGCASALRNAAASTVEFASRSLLGPGPGPGSEDGAPGDSTSPARRFAKLSGAGWLPLDDWDWSQRQSLHRQSQGGDSAGRSEQMSDALPDSAVLVFSSAMRTSVDPPDRDNLCAEALRVVAPSAGSATHVSLQLATAALPVSAALLRTLSGW